MALIALVALVAVAVPIARTPQPRDMTYSALLRQVDAGDVERVRIHTEDNALEVEPRKGRAYETA